MRCAICGAGNPEGALFCASCGGKFETSASVSPLWDQVNIDLTREPAPPQPAYAAQPSVYPDAAQPGYPAQPAAHVDPRSPAYDAPGYGYPAAPYGVYQNPPAAGGNASKNWAAVTGLILGILAIPCCGALGLILELFRVSYFAALLLAVPALVFSIIGLKSQKSGLAIAGLVCSLAGLMMTLLLGISLLSQLQDPGSPLYNFYYEYYRAVY